MSTLTSNLYPKKTDVGYDENKICHSVGSEPCVPHLSEPDENFLFYLRKAKILYLNQRNE